MGLFDFVRDAGAKIFGDKAAAADKADVDAAVKKVQAQQALTKVVHDMGLKVDQLNISFDDGTAIVYGKTPTQQEREKIVLLIGNTNGVARVDDRLTVDKPEPEATMYTVKSGDTLSKIAKAHYGDAMKYPMIFEANRPMLADPDKIYPGQVLRLPPATVKSK